MPTQKLNLLPSYQKHILSLAVSILCMAAAMGLSCVLHKTTSRYSINITLLFVFFLIIVSCCTIGYLYSVLYCILTVCYFLKLDIISSCFPITLFLLLAITVLVCALASHLTLQANTIVQMEKKISEAETEKERANLLRAISHDLRTPLTGIIGNSMAFLENQPHLSEKQKTNIVTNIYEDSKWLINMVENLLSVTRIRDRDLCISTQEESVEEVVAEALQKMEKRHPECMIHAKVPDEFIMLPMDAILIEQVTINLLENALYHSRSKEPIDLIVEDIGKEISFTVRDYGVGIPVRKLKDLFNGKDDTDPHPGDSHKGMGIGLSICKTIITAHHGSLTGKNCECGAEFTFTLPKAKEEALSNNRKERYDHEHKNQHPAY